MSKQLKEAQAKERRLASEVEDVTEERDMLQQRLREAQEDSERRLAESEAAWKRRLADQQARADAERQRAVDAKAMETKVLLSREVR